MLRRQSVQTRARYAKLGINQTGQALDPNSGPMAAEFKPGPGETVSVISEGCRLRVLLKDPDQDRYRAHQTVCGAWVGLGLALEYTFASLTPTISLSVQSI